MAQTWPKTRLKKDFMCMAVSLDELCDFPRLFDTFKSQKLHEFYGQDETHIIYESVKF